MNFSFYAYGGRTESGDELRVLLFSTEPTRKEVDARYRELYPEEYSEVGFVNWHRLYCEVVR